MMREAEQFAEQDKKKLEEAEARNKADSIIYTAEKTKAELKDKLSSDQIEQINKGINELKEALAGKDVDKIKAKTEQLAKTLQEIGAFVYQKAGAQRAYQASSTSSSKGKTINADYEVEK